MPFLAVFKTVLFWARASFSFFHGVVSEPKQVTLLSLLLQLAGAEPPVGQAQGACTGTHFSSRPRRRAGDESFQERLAASRVKFRALGKKTRALRLNLQV